GEFGLCGELLVEPVLFLRDPDTGPLAFLVFGAGDQLEPAQLLAGERGAGEGGVLAAAGHGAGGHGQLAGGRDGGDGAAAGRRAGGGGGGGGRGGGGRVCASRARPPRRARAASRRGLAWRCARAGPAPSRTG